MNIYFCIDLKSFFASVECVERGLDPFKTNLVVADPDRQRGTICLAITPAMKALGVKNRCRVFEIPKGIDYITATPRMKKYIDYSAEIYSVYLSYFSKDDIHIYSVDEVFIDATRYLKMYGKEPKELAIEIMDKIYELTGIKSACGIGTNLYLTKIALDITAKKSEDFIGFLDEETYIKNLWDHKPITDFWRIGRGIAIRLAEQGIFTMGDIAKANENLLYKMFGIDAELLIDHAYGIEPTTMKDIKEYKSKTNCLTRGQVLMRDYTFDETMIIVKEMTDALCLEMEEYEVITDSVTLYIGYSKKEEKTYDRGTVKLPITTSSSLVITPAVADCFGRIADHEMFIRRLSITCNKIIPDNHIYQMGLFEDNMAIERNRKLQKAVCGIRNNYGKNAVIKGTSLYDASTAIERNKQIGGHKSGK